MRIPVPRSIQTPNNRILVRVVLALLAAVVLVAGAFAGYYYLDRYTAPNVASPAAKDQEHLEQLVRQKPQDPDARLALAQYDLEHGAYAEAVDNAQQVMRAYPDRLEALYIAGVAGTRAGQAQDAIEPLEKLAAVRRASPAAGVDSGLEATLYYLGENYVKLNMGDKAIAVLQEALTIDSTDADAMYQLALAYAQGGQHQLALEQLERAVLFVPDLAEAYQQMALSYAALSKSSYVTYAQGMEAFSVKDYARARSTLEQAVAELPDFAPGQLGLGLTYERLGNLELARASYERVLVLDPENLMARYGLSNIAAPDTTNGGVHVAK